MGTAAPTTPDEASVAAGSGLESRRARTRRRLDAVALPAVFGFAVILLGSVRVGDTAYWLDEAATEVFVDRSFGDMLAFIWRREAGMGPYYLGLWGWRHLFDGDSGMRMFSVLGGALAAALVVAFARRWFDSQVALVAGVLFVTNPFFLRYLTELRAYSWAMATAVAAVWLMLEFVRSPTPVLGAALAVVTAGAVATLYFTAAWIVAVVVGLMLTGQITRRLVLPLAAVAVAAGVLLAPFLHAITTRRSQVDWIAPTTLGRTFDAVRTALGGGSSLVVIGVGVALAAVALGGRARSDERRDVLAVDLVAVLLGPALFVVASLLKPLLVSRYMAATLPFATVAAAAGYVAFGRRFGTDRWRDVAVPSLVVAIALSGFVVRGPLSDETRAADPRAAVAWVLQRIEPGDQVAIVGAPAGVMKYLGDRPDIDPGRPESDGGRGVARRRFAEVVAHLELAPTVFVFVWGEQDDPELERFTAGRTTAIEDFGQVDVVVVETGA